MKLYIIIGLVLTLISCGENQKKEQSNTTIDPATAQEATAVEETDINGKWQITKVTGGPVKIYPSGKSQPGIEIDFDPIWKGGSFEFTNGICFLAIPNTPQDQIGGYKVKANTIVFDNTEGEEQQMAFTLDDNTMTLSLDAEAYQKLLEQKSNGQVEMDIDNPIIFYLKKQ